LKLLPYVNNEHIANVYKLYAPSKQDLYKIYGNKKYIENIQKSKRGNLDNSLINHHSIIHHANVAPKVVSKRKLSPINKKMIRI
jgi:hypothetical protein